MIPGNAAAPGVETEGGSNIQQGRADTPILGLSPAEREAPRWLGVPPTTAEEREEAAKAARERLWRAEERHRASRELDRLLGVGGGAR